MNWWQIQNLPVIRCHSNIQVSVNKPLNCWSWLTVVFQATYDIESCLQDTTTVLLSCLLHVGDLEPLVGQNWVAEWLWYALFHITSGSKDEFVLKVCHALIIKILEGWIFSMINVPHSLAQIFNHTPLIAFAQNIQAVRNLNDISDGKINDECLLHSASIWVEAHDLCPSNDSE